VIFGFTEFVQYGIFACLFYFGQIWWTDYGENPETVFKALYAIMFGAWASAQA